VHISSSHGVIDEVTNRSSFSTKHYQPRSIYCFHDSNRRKSSFPQVCCRFSQAAKTEEVYLQHVFQGTVRACAYELLLFASR